MTNTAMLIVKIRASITRLILKNKRFKGDHYDQDKLGNI